MKALAIAGLAMVFACPAHAQGSGNQTQPIPQIKIETTLPGYPGELIRDADLRGDRSAWWRATDYPAVELRARRTGMATLDVQIGANDTLVACRPVADESDAAFVDAGCAILRRGRFVHALRSDGRASAGRLTVYIKFDLHYPGDRPAVPPGPVAAIGGRAPAPAQSDAYIMHGVDPASFPDGAPFVRADVKADGSVRSCFIGRSSGTDAGDILSCRHVMAMRFAPAAKDAPFTYFELAIGP